MSLPQSQSNIVELKSLDALIERLGIQVDAAKTNSNDFYSKASRLAAFTLSCDQEKGVDKPPDAEGLLTELNNLISRLQYINKRNLEILQQIDQIM
jgi:hypothetical protein